MMSQRTIGVLAGALVLLVLTSWLTSRSKYAVTEGGGFQPLFEQPVDPASIQTIKAWVGAIPDTTVELARSGEGWVVATRWNWPAKKDLVEQVFADLKDLRGEVRSSTDEVLADYKIDDADGMHLVATGAGGTELFHLVVGKTSLRGGCFVRKSGSNEVLLTTASLRSPFGLWGEDRKPVDPKRWLELRVTDVERNDVDRIVLRDGSSEIVLEKAFGPAVPDTAGGAPKPDRTNWTWKPDAKGEIDKAKADGILGTLTNLYAADVIEPKDAAEYGLDGTARVAELAMADGKTIRIRFGAALEDGKMRVVQVGDAGTPAKIYASTVDRVFPKRSDLKPQTS
jgi:hypothetical protein